MDASRTTSYWQEHRPTGLTVLKLNNFWTLTCSERQLAKQVTRYWPG